MPKIIGLITANYSTKFPSALSDSRPAASMPFLGRYRAVDFALSNMVNCGIRTVGMVMPYNYRSLIDHVGSGREWELTRKSGGLFILPGSAFGTSRTGSRFLLRDLIHNKIFLERDKAEHVIVSSASWVYNMDYKELVDAHVASGADITAVTQAAHDKDVDVCGLDVVDGRVKGIKHGIVFGDTAFLDCFVVGRERLLEILDWYAANDYLDLFEALAGEYDRVNVQAYEFEGYAAPIFNKDAYFKANMDMLDPKITRELFSIRPIKTKAHDNQPAKFEAGCKVTNSRVSGSCRIRGTVINSILGRGVTIEKGAVVEDAIIMQGCVIKSGAHVQHAVVDRNNVVPEGTELCGTESAILIKGKA
ncbi:MAG: glucose-1-phosphate adenylyltransferase subunit GlgD [Acidobacteriota bacterium]|nr:glucose-1-phosphate adenylyltransferase subunit GlgD [Acidobacteriota bacterium]